MPGDDKRRVFRISEMTDRDTADEFVQCIRNSVGTDSFNISLYNIDDDINLIKLAKLSLPPRFDSVDVCGHQLLNDMSRGFILFDHFINNAIENRHRISVRDNSNFFVDPPMGIEDIFYHVFCGDNIRFKFNYYNNLLILGSISIVSGYNDNYDSIGRQRYIAELKWAGEAVTAEDESKDGT